MISVAIPTIGRRETLHAVIFSVFQQAKCLLEELIILDEGDTPISEDYQIRQAIDLLSVYGITTKVIRNRNRKGIANARLVLLKECKSEFVLMLDDDVCLDRDCVESLFKELSHNSEIDYVVPVCLLVQKEAAAYSEDSLYNANKVTREDVKHITDKMPWFIPYFRYKDEFKAPIKVSGTQAILLRKSKAMPLCEEMAGLGKLPREDTYLTSQLKGMFISKAESYHFVHPSQTREWGKDVFYELHHKVMDKPKMFIELFA